MFTHVLVGTNDMEKAQRFYDNVLGPLGYSGGEFAGKYFYSGPGGSYGFTKPLNGEVACHANGGTVGFVAKSREEVDAFHAAGLANGGTCEGAPGVRDSVNRYGAYLRDPDGNKICAFVVPK